MKKSFSFIILFIILIYLIGCKDSVDNGIDYKPGIINTHFDTSEIIIADYIIDKETGADPTGKKDSTNAIQQVLNDCRHSGGGTVFLPKGKYLVKKNIQIPSFVYLRGDYNDPDKKGFNGDYGTVIIADVEPSTIETRSPVLADREDIYSNFPSLFTVGGSAAIIGVTIYYPKQTIDDVIPYPFAIEIPSFAGMGAHQSHMAATIKDITFINVYKGICASVTSSSSSAGMSAAHEMVHIENVKGTVLYQGMQLYNASEAGVIRDINFSNDYWANSYGDLLPADRNKLDAFTKNHTVGMLLGDLEWDVFTNISISDVCIGIRIYDGLRRFIKGQPTVYFIGQFYNLTINNVVTGLRVDNMYPNFGITISESSIKAEKYSIYEIDPTKSNIKLVGTELEGAVFGNSLYESVTEAYNTFRIVELVDTIRPEPEKPKSTLYDVCKDFGADPKGDNSSADAIQNALNTAKNNGGGIVYLKAGYYRIDKPLVVYANTELRGCASANTRDQLGLSLGTVIMANYGYTTSDKAESDTALITLSEDNAGIRGIRIIYYDNKPNPTGNVQYKYHSYVIRATAYGNYAIHLSLVGVPYGIQFNNAQNGIVYGVNGTFYKKGVDIESSNNIYVEEFLSNASVVSRMGYGIVPSFISYFLYGWPTDGMAMNNMYDYITRPDTQLITANNSNNISLLHVMTFASKQVYNGTNSSVKILSSMGDNLKSGSEVLYLDGGQMSAVNLLIYINGNLFTALNNSRVNIYNNLTLHFTTNFTIDDNIVENKRVAPQKIMGVSSDENPLPNRYIR